MIQKSTTDNAADDEFEITSDDETWPAESDDPALEAGATGKPPRKQSALRSIEERRERERLRRELEELDFERDHGSEAD